MANKKNTKVDLATLSPEALLAFAKEAEAIVAQREAEAEKAKANIEQLEKDLAAEQKKVENLDAKATKAAEDLEDALEVNEELQKELENKPAKGALPEVTHDGKKYHVVIPTFRLKGETHSAETLRKNKELVAELVEMNSSVLKLKD